MPLEPYDPMDKPGLFPDAMVQRLTLRKIHLEYCQLFDASRVREHVDIMPHLGHTVQHHFATYVMGMHEQRIDKEWPRDWWEAFKERWFFRFGLRWWVRRWPVRRESIHTDVYKAVCPHIEPRDDRECFDFIAGRL